MDTVNKRAFVLGVILLAAATGYLLMTGGFEVEAILLDRAPFVRDNTL